LQLNCYGVVFLVIIPKFLLVASLDLSRLQPPDFSIHYWPLIILLPTTRFQQHKSYTQSELDRIGSCTHKGSPLSLLYSYYSKSEISRDNWWKPSVTDSQTHDMEESCSSTSHKRTSSSAGNTAEVLPVKRRIEEKGNASSYAARPSKVYIVMEESSFGELTTDIHGVYPTLVDATMHCNASPMNILRLSENSSTLSEVLRRMAAFGGALTMWATGKQLGFISTPGK